MLRYPTAFVVALGLAAFALAAPPSPDPKSLAVPDEERSKARELVQQLGSEEFAEREEAQRLLASMGRLAREALFDGVTADPDPEVRLRCRLLLPKANADDLKARIDTFLADTEGKYEHDLPGWHKLRAAVRGEWKMLGWTCTARPNADKAARELFIDIINTPGGRQLLAALGGPSGELGQLVSTRKYELYYARYPRVPGVQPRQPSVVEVAALLFAESQVHSRDVPRSIAITNLLTIAGFNNDVQGSTDRALALRALLEAWFDSRTEGAEIYQAMSMANSPNMNMPGDACRLATRLLSMSGATPLYRGQALGTLVKTGSKDHLPTIEKLIGDNSVMTTLTTIVNGQRVRTTIQVGDTALTAAVLLTGQKLEDYGIQDRLPTQPNTAFSYTRYIIPEDKRNAATAKWKEWREKNP